MAKKKLSKDKWKQWEERKKLILSADFRLADSTEAKEARIERARKDYQYFVEKHAYQPDDSCLAYDPGNADYPCNGIGQQIGRQRGPPFVRFAM